MASGCAPKVARDSGWTLQLSRPLVVLCLWLRSLLRLSGWGGPVIVVHSWVGLETVLLNSWAEPYALLLDEILG